MNVIYILDIILVSLWALFALCNPENGTILVFPVIIIRLSSVFCLQLRERKAWMPILVFSVIALSSMTLRTYDFNDYVLRPFARMYDYVIMLLSGQSTLLDGAYHYLGNHGDLVPAPGLSWNIFVYCYIGWLILCPIALYSFLSLYKRLRASHWNWKRIIIVSILYVLFSGIILTIKVCDYTILPGAGRMWWLAILLIPLIAKIRWMDLSLWVRRYVIMVLLFAIAIMAGFYMQSVGSLIAIIVSVPQFYYYVGYKWCRTGSANLNRNLYLLMLAGLSFWTAQYAIYETRDLLLSTSTILSGIVAFQLWRKTRKVATAFVIFIVCAFLLPSIAIGYNQFTCTESKRLYNFTDYDYSYRGLLKVGSLDEEAIRDRFGYITPLGFNKIQPMGDSTKPYIKVYVEEYCGIYDLERQEYIIDPDPNISNILQYDNNVWKLMSKEGNGYGYESFFIGPAYYYRYEQQRIESECPFKNRLAQHLSLRYDYRDRNPEGLDYLLSELMTPLWNKPDSVSHADFYWNWAKGVSSTIDSLHNVHDMFFAFGDGGLYNDAMDDLEDYIDPSLACGGRAEMNAGSYVVATIENYRMMNAVQELADILPEVNIRKEYELFNEFMSSFEDWRGVWDDRHGRYADWTLVQNCNAAKRFKDRKESVEDFISVVKGDTIIPATPYYLFANKAFDKLARAYEPAAELVPPVRKNFQKWIDYRNAIASLFPQHAAASYRYQTIQLEKFYTSDEFLYEDEF